MAGPYELIVAAFKDETKADQALKHLRSLAKKDVLDVVNAAVLVKDEQGRVSQRETEDLHPGQGAVFGALVGGLVGLLGGPLGVALGAAAGAATGGIAAQRLDMGFSNAALAELQSGLQPGSSALLAIVEHRWVVKVAQALEAYEAKLYRQSLIKEIAEQIKQDADESAE